LNNNKKNKHACCLPIGIKNDLPKMQENEYV
jgi:hypothetical protein